VKALRAAHEADIVKLDAANKELLDMHRQEARLKEQLQEVSSASSSKVPFFYA
jgi:hypothetical protein